MSGSPCLAGELAGNFSPASSSPLHLVSTTKLVDEWVLKSFGRY
jgi:hypothetical protein